MTAKPNLWVVTNSKIKKRGVRSETYTIASSSRHGITSEIYFVRLPGANVQVTVYETAIDFQVWYRGWFDWKKICDHTIERNPRK
jgi:hypothetical protein